MMTFKLRLRDKTDVGHNTYTCMYMLHFTRHYKDSLQKRLMILMLFE